MNNGGKVYLLGDSITQGLGSKKINFTKDLSLLLGDKWDVLNLAHTGTMIDFALNLVKSGKIKPAAQGRTICVIAYGNVDAQIRPSQNGIIYPHLPKRYKGGGMLMPRPFYSHSIMKKIGQKMDNAGRFALRQVIKLIDGTEQWMPIDSFINTYTNVIKELDSLGIEIICCSCVYIDEKLFPNSREQYISYNKKIKELAHKNGSSYIDLFTTFDKCVKENGWNSMYNKDHFHPNSEGYRVMAKEISSTILEA